MYILLQFFNDYDQHGGYFAGAFESVDDVFSKIDHVDRVDNEYSWYKIINAETGVLYGTVCEGDISGFRVSTDEN